MNKLRIFLLLIITINCYSQDVRFNTSIMTDPSATIKDGFNIGTSIEYQMTYTYTKVELFVFPKLRGMNYVQLYCTPFTALNFHLLDNHLRVFVGFKVGFLMRENSVYPSIAFESGLEYYFTNNIYIGLQSEYNYRNDISFLIKI